MFSLIFSVVLIFFIAWLIGIIKETHQKVLIIEEKLENIEKALENLKDPK